VSTWSHDDRSLIFFAIYQYIFLDSQHTDIDWYTIAEASGIVDYRSETVAGAFAQFLDSIQAYTTELKTYLRNWSITYPLVKSILFVALTEISSEGEQATLHRFSDYLRLTQDFAGSESVGLIHAVLSKIFEARGLNPKKLTSKSA